MKVFKFSDDQGHFFASISIVTVVVNLQILGY